MTTTLYICIVIVILLLLVGFAWRTFSRRASLPCPAWLAWLVEVDNPFPSSYNTRTIIQRLDLQPGMKVLDVGCGPGRLTIPIAQQISPRGEVTAIDIQPGMLRRAQMKAQVAKLTNIQFLQLGIGEGKLDGAQYDRALLVTVLGEIPDRHRALQEIYDALKPGGILSVTEIIFDPHYQSRTSIMRLASSFGFQEKSFFGNRLSFTLNLEKPASS
jgi:2-polyprenyl-3-methyl-5-hydroxy-6-metoxy-1,4-benzoquinol methylase